MKKLDLNKVAEEFEMISSDTHLFYNTQTGGKQWRCGLGRNFGTIAQIKEIAVRSAPTG